MSPARRHFRITPPKCFSAARSSGSSTSSSGTPASAAAHACRMLAIPAAGPSGWPSTPPPASTSRSVVPARSRVTGAVPAHWADDRTGRQGKPPSSGSRTAATVAATSSSVT
ncbi:hypothetical protein [Nonomuraea sp. B19D2]|uniref:hypothetical protein n=1 Tax=Nonomuraea sp. B19D2 TaxID=3159561 RepID=UPI0032DBD230